MADIETLTHLLDRLDEADIHYHLSSVRESSVLVSVTIDEEHWEFEFQADGNVEVQVFVSDGEIEDESGIERFFDEHVGDEEEGDEDDDDEDEYDDEEDEEDDD